MIPARNAIAAHALEFVANDELLLPILKTSVARHENYKLHAISDIYSLCRVVLLFVASTNSSPVVPPTASSHLLRVKSYLSTQSWQHAKKRRYRSTNSQPPHWQWNFRVRLQNLSLGPLGKISLAYNGNQFLHGPVRTPVTIPTELPRLPKFQDSCVCVCVCVCMCVCLKLPCAVILWLHSVERYSDWWNGQDLEGKVASQLRYNPDTDCRDWEITTQPAV
jgi:hypothetical protein